MKDSPSRVWTENNIELTSVQADNVIGNPFRILLSQKPCLDILKPRTRL